MITLRTTRNLKVSIPLLGDLAATAHFGHDNGSLEPVEVLLLNDNHPVSPTEIRAVQKWRSANQTRRVVVCSTHSETATICGPVDDRQPLLISPNTAQRLLQRFLDDQSPINASRELISYYDSQATTELGGVKNKGLFASHHIRENLPQRSDWASLRGEGRLLATKRHRELITALGFTVSSEDRNAVLLAGATGEERAVALLLEDTENFDSPGGRFPSGPVSWGLAVAAEHKIPWLIVLRRDQIRLHPGRDGVGVGQKGQAETYFELNLSQVDDSHVALLPLIFSATALEMDGAVQRILEESSRYAATLGARLRERVYDHVVPDIAIAVAKQLQARGVTLDTEGLSSAYSITLKILFRLLFQAYAEDRGLLPAGRNEGYDANSLKTLAKRDINAVPEDFGEIASIWADLQQVWDAIDSGNPRWQVPAYKGGLFGRDAKLNAEGALIHTLELPDSVLGPALQALLIDNTEDGVRGPVDFRSLSVREFGTIYEGLLESSLSIAEVNLTLDAKDAWVPANDDDLVFALAGDPYFHSASGDRKATGSYFTPSFVVDHLVSNAIDPTLDKHLASIETLLRKGDEATAARQFFDFRVADLAMGSAHFLVAAVDRIEAKMRAFLSHPGRSVAGVTDEIARLRASATVALAADHEAIREIEDTSLLRRQIARRCIYGLDINPMAVELARLAIWIHTFVPGLPMSSLNHNLVCANSLTGIGSVEEALKALIPSRQQAATIFDSSVFDGLEVARELLIDAAQASEADKAEVAASSRILEEARAAATEARYIFDAAVAVRLRVLDSGSLFPASAIVSAGMQTEVQTLMAELKPAHMPSLFPEVFLRENGGFDALIGNPPWEKVKIDEQRWWGLRLPGIRALSKDKKDRAIKEFRSLNPMLDADYERDLEHVALLRRALQHDTFPGMGSGGDLDLANVFSWRNWQFLRDGGKFGVVLPRSAMSATALGLWRRDILEKGRFDSVVFASNRREWLFAKVDERLSVCFLTASKEPGQVIQIGGPVHTVQELAEISANLKSVPVQEFASWSDSLTFPVVDDGDALEIFRQFKKAPKLLSANRGVQVRAYRELDATNDSELFSTDIKDQVDYPPVWGGSSFNIWDPNFGGPWARSSSPNLRSIMRDRLERSTSKSISPYFGWKTSDSLPMDRCRVAYRWVTNRTNSRTTVVCLIPPGVAVNSAPVFVFPEGSEYMEAFLLGVMSSIIFDWQARRVVEGNLTFELLGQLTCPWQGLDSRLGTRLVEVSSRLASPDDRFHVWADALATPVGSIESQEEKEQLMAEIDAIVAYLYGFTHSQVQYIFETFHRGWDFQPRLKKVLACLDAIGDN